ncbi:MAG TPA: hypothetical protein VF062_25220 [Candidatus Limnocylindrales bacterium]
MTIKIVLDSTAALSYSKGLPHVGETVGELFDEPGTVFAVPVVALAEAGTITDDAGLLVLLGHHERGVVTPVVADRWEELMTLSQLLGSVSCAVPYMLATAHEAYLLTATPDRYPDADRVIDISDN